METLPERVRFRVVFDNIVKNGTRDELVNLLKAVPQRDKNGKFVWLLTSGMAAELVTGVQREHHDLDTVFMNLNPSKSWVLRGTDTVTPGEYWADMKFDPEYLEQTAVQTDFDYGGKTHRVEVVHPAILIIQKLSDDSGLGPRTIDIQDAAHLLRQWRSYGGKSAADINIANRAIEALPLSARQTTELRLEYMTKNLDCINSEVYVLGVFTLLSLLLRAQESA